MLLKQTIVSLTRQAYRLGGATRHYRCKFKGRPIVHVLHIGKTGGTALKVGLRPYLDVGPYSIFLHGHETTFEHVPRDEKIVFFLRHPVDRFVSGFYSRQRQGRPRLNVPWTAAEARAFARFPTANDLALSLSAAAPDTRDQAILAMNAIGHVRDSFYKWVGSDTQFHDRIPDILFIGFQERFEEDFRRLRDLLRLPETVAPPQDDVVAHRNPPCVDRRLEEQAIANLHSWYRRDINFYEACDRLSMTRLGSGATSRAAGT